MQSRNDGLADADLSTALLPNQRMQPTSASGPAFRSTQPFGVELRNVG